MTLKDTQVEVKAPDAQVTSKKLRKRDRLAAKLKLERLSFIIKEEKNFLESFGTSDNEVEEDAPSAEIIDSRKPKDMLESLTKEDLEGADIDTTSIDGDGSISFLESFTDNMDIDAPRSTSYSSRDPQASPPPNFAGGATRRKGDRHLRTMQRFEPAPEIKPASTGTVAESFMSLRSFTTLHSFTSSVTSDQSKTVTVGNLIFATDVEMEALMYGEGNADRTVNSSDQGYSVGPGSSSSPSLPSKLSSSLPPSAILGTGAFSTVRLAWRKTHGHTKEKEEDAVDAVSKRSLHDTVQDDTEREPCQSIVNAQSEKNNVYPNASLEHKGELVAVKIIQKSILKQMKTIQKGPNNRLTVHTAFDNIEREIATMKRLHHPNLVRLYEVIDSVESDRMHIVLEYVSLGEILSHVEGTDRYTRMRYRKKVKGLTEGGHFDEKHAALYFVDVMHGLAYLHRNGICHRDLKPENILLCSSGIAKISDFGLAYTFEDEQAREPCMLAALDSLGDLLSDCDDNDEKGGSTNPSKCDNYAALTMSSKHNRGILKKTEGTWCFWSPEMCSIESKGFSGYACDLWAAGVCLYIFTTGMLPFFSIVPSVVFDLIAKAEISFDGLGLSNELQDLLGKLFDKDVSTRAGIGDCLKHGFCADARIERIDELGNRFQESEKQIILSKNDVEMALSVTMAPNHDAFRKVTTHFSALASSLSAGPACTVTAPTASVSSTIVKNNHLKLTTLEDTQVEVKAPNSPGSSKKLRKRDRLAAKLKLKQFWGFSSDEE